MASNNKEQYFMYSLATIVVIVLVVALVAFSSSPKSDVAGDAIRGYKDSWNGYLPIDSAIYTRGGTGDIDGNGEIQNSDKNDYLLQYLRGNRLLSNEEYARADINGDGRVSWDDYAIISKLIGMGRNSPNYWNQREIAIRSIDGLYGANNNMFYVNGYIRINALSGNGNAYACVNQMGVIYRSNVPCR